VGDQDLSFKPVKCVSYLFEYLQNGIRFSKGATRSIIEGGTKFLGTRIA